MTNGIEAKLARLATGAAPRVLDLFSGCGGMALGFSKAGCQSLGGVELDADAARSFATNFHRGLPDALFEEHAKPKDITATDPVALLSALGHDRPRAVVDFLVGGPPCPTFTRVGRAKLREVQQHPEAFRHDPRAQLYVPYLRFVKELSPVALVMENVPDFLNWGGHNLAEEICEVLEGLGYRCAYTLLNAANYGVPQMRDRFFLIAIHKLAGVPVRFPTPTHEVDLPPGYEGSRDVALKHIRELSLFSPKLRYVASPSVSWGAPPALTVAEAIADLPPITGHLDGSIRRGARRFNECTTYRQDAVPSAYARLMREFPGFGGDGRIWDHVIRSLSDRDYRLFRHMQHGDEYPEAHALAVKLFEAERHRLRRARANFNEDALHKAFVPPYDPAKFPNKWRKMEPDTPSRTLMAHLGKDSYSHIHYDSEQAR